MQNSTIGVVRAMGRRRLLLGVLELGP
jgi:hypothetical protein